MHSKVKTRYACGVRLIDAVTGSWPTDKDLKIFLQNVSARPIVKSDGYVAFLDLSPGTYKLVVQSSRYFDARLDISIEELNLEYPVQVLTLWPRPSYPFAAGVSLIRGVLENKQGHPLAGVALHGEMLSDGAYIAKLAQSASMDTTVLSLTDMRTPIFHGEKLLLVDRKKEVIEHCRILFNAEENSRNFHLEAPIQHEFERGTNLYPFLFAQTDERGQWVMLLRTTELHESILQISSPFANVTEDVIVHPRRTAQLRLCAN